MNTFAQFKEVVEEELFTHPVIRSNPYTAWFSAGSANTPQVRDLLTQFSVFSNQFIAIQAKRLVNARSEEGEKAARSILLNECGVGIDLRTGSAEGRSFAARNAHLNWLRETGAGLGLSPRSLGRWESASSSTRKFLEGLEETYGSRDDSAGAGASFAVETWAGFGIRQPAPAQNFWRELVSGMEGYNARRRRAKGLEPLPLGFFRYHLAMESGHGAGVWQELKESFSDPGFSPGRFLEAGKRTLDCVLLFWQGLDERRKALAWAEEEALALAAGF